MALAGRATRARFGVRGRGARTPLRVRHRERRRPDGGDLRRGGLAGGAPRARQPDLPLRRQPRSRIDGPTSLCFSEDVAARFEAQRWHVQAGRRRGPRRPAPRAGGGARRDGAAVARDRAHRDRPREPGPGRQEQGARLAARRRRGPAHQAGGRLAARAEFLVPDDVRAYFAERIREKRARAREARRRARALARGEPGEGGGLGRGARAPPAPRSRRARSAAGLEGKDDATRKHGAVVLERLAAAAPYLVGGSADLAGSAAPPILKGRGIVGRAPRRARIPSRASTSTSACASTRWARSPTASRSTAPCGPTAAPS